MSTAAAPSASIGDQLKAIVENQGLTGCEVAHRAGVSARAVQRWMAGERDIRLETADRIGRALGVRLVETGPRRRARVEPT
jgi:transcriptional regulator with XRE-family HTH domain